MAQVHWEYHPCLASLWQIFEGSLGSQTSSDSNDVECMNGHHPIDSKGRILHCWVLVRSFDVIEAASDDSSCENCSRIDVENPPATRHQKDPWKQTPELAGQKAELPDLPMPMLLDLTIMG